MKDIHVTDREIDALMAEYGYEWDEGLLCYQKLNGEYIVNGDFASDMCKRIKLAEANKTEVKQ